MPDSSLLHPEWTRIGNSSLIHGVPREYIPSMKERRRCNLQLSSCRRFRGAERLNETFRETQRPSMVILRAMRSDRVYEASTTRKYLPIICHADDDRTDQAGGGGRVAPCACGLQEGRLVPNKDPAP